MLRILQHCLRTLLRNHFRHILLRSADHAGADDVDEDVDSSTGWFDDGLDTVVDVLPTRTTGIDDGRHPVGQRMLIRKQPAGITTVDMDVDIDESWCDEQSGYVDVSFGINVETSPDCLNRTVADGHVRWTVDVILRVDDVSTAQEYVTCRHGVFSPSVWALAVSQCGGKYSLVRR
ncbi:MAG TPA: hypothetical protein EYQ31_13205 [Candidatus Handelsmanbacteria bacterium]|nr:hypothetical protein [Candidatus Handelsmanbacteria bacterium]